MNVGGKHVTASKGKRRFQEDNEDGDDENASTPSEQTEEDGGSTTVAKEEEEEEEKEVVAVVEEPLADDKRFLTCAAGKFCTDQKTVPKYPFKLDDNGNPTTKYDHQSVAYKEVAKLIEGHQAEMTSSCPKCDKNIHPGCTDSDETHCLLCLSKSPECCAGTMCVKDGGFVKAGVFCRECWKPCHQSCARDLQAVPEKVSPPLQPSAITTGACLPCIKRSRALTLQLRDQLPTEARLAALKDTIGDDDSCQGGVTKASYGTALAHYKERNQNLQKAKKTLIQVRDRTDVMKAEIVAAKTDQKRKLLEAKLKVHQQDSHQVARFVKQQNSTSGDSSLDALLDQKDGYDALYCGLKAPDMNMSYLKVNHYDDDPDSLKWWVLMSDVAQQKMGKETKNNIWVQVKESWVYANHKTPIIAQALASQDGFTPITVGNHGAKERAILQIDTNKDDWVVKKWEVTKNHHQRLIDAQGFLVRMFGVTYVLADNYNTFMIATGVRPQPNKKQKRPIEVKKEDRRSSGTSPSGWTR